VSRRHASFNEKLEDMRSQLERDRLKDLIKRVHDNPRQITLRTPPMPDSPAEPSEYWIVERRASESEQWVLWCSQSNALSAHNLANQLNYFARGGWQFRSRRFIPAEQP
jgi:hypothetical protein